jgi:hypothetical protein
MGELDILFLLGTVFNSFRKSELPKYPVGI